MSSFNFNWLKKAASAVVTFGKDNATSILTGGSICLWWGTMYVFWIESKKAESIIRKEETKLNADKNTADSAQLEKLPTKEKAVIYGQCCWKSALMALTATGLGIYSHKLSMDEIAKAYMVTQFFQDKSDKQEKLIDKLKGELPDKKIHELENDLIEEEYPDEEVMDYYFRTGGGNKTLFIDEVTHAKWRAEIIDVTNGIDNVNRILKKRRRKLIRKRGTGAFDVVDNVWGTDVDGVESESDDDDQYDRFNDIYSVVGLDVLLDAIGETTDDGISTRLNELLEFRYFGGGDLLKPKDILKFKQYADPETGIPAVCFVDYTEFLSPTFELTERNPL